MLLNRFRVALLVLVWLGAIPSAVAAEPRQDPSAFTGQAVYDQHCAACHGVNGDGNGPAAIWLFPKPRNFSAGLFKIQSTPAASLPTDEDLFETITRGMPGSSMPSFTYLPERERRDVVQYVKYLTAEVDATGKRVNKFAEAIASGRQQPPVVVPPEPAVTVDALTKGKETYTRLQCFTCHGEHGAGDGASAATLKDNWGLPLPPRDFNFGQFRGGSTGRDLYLRIHNGLAGTPMPPFGEGIMTPEERWALVLHIQSLRQKDVEISDMLAPNDGRIHALKVRALPATPTDAAWEKWEPVRVTLNPLWPEPVATYAVSVKAVHDGKRLAVLLQWKDALANGAPVRVEDFQDGVALQFSVDGTTPFLGMGDAQHPVNLWMWKAGWQQDADGKREDVETIHPSLHVDVYSQTNLLHRTAAAAGNLQAAPTRRSPVEDAIARGFGTFQNQPADRQNVAGHGVWRDGHWNVLVQRELKSPDREDVQFKAGQTVPVAFAIWDGEHNHRNGRKLISNWYRFEVD